MPTINAETAQGSKTIEGTAGRRLVLVLEDGGVDILPAVAEMRAAPPAASRCWTVAHHQWVKPNAKL